MSPAPLVSVIVPTLDEADLVSGALRSARAAFGSEAELIVADGGSRDGTRRAAERRARVVGSRPGRGRQMNAGARESRGEVLVFLHADTVVEPRTGRDLERALADPGVAGGCLRFALARRPGRPPVRRVADALLESAVRARTRLFRTATGDQVLFARRKAFEAVGGFPDYPLFEDVELVRRLKEVGRFRVLPARAVTSPRRWDEEGWVRTAVLHLALRGAYHLGVPADRLSDWYGRPVRSRRAGSANRG